MYNKNLVIRKNELDTHLNGKTLRLFYFCLKPNFTRIVKQKSFNHENPVPNSILPRKQPGIFNQCYNCLETCARPKELNPFWKKKHTVATKKN